MQSIVDVRKNIPSGTIVINNPKLANAIPAFGYLQLRQALDDLHQEKSVRAIILTGSGNVFSSGTDLKQLNTELQREAQASHQDIQLLNELLLAMLRFPKPIIAALNGPAIGSAAALALGCDFVIAAKQATLQLPEVKLGLAAGSAATMLNFRVGAAIAARYSITGQPISAEIGSQMGLIHDVVEEDLVWARAHQLAVEIESTSSQSIQMTKRLLNESVADQLETQLQVSGAMTAAARTTSHANLGINAFLEKETPEWG
ncbi:MAG: enoyl-CoA hydratase/isomerase family protein [Pirellulaceae bacterium]